EVLARRGRARSGGAVAGDRDVEAITKICGGTLIVEQLGCRPEQNVEPLVVHEGADCSHDECVGTSYTEMPPGPLRIEMVAKQAGINTIRNEGDARTVHSPGGELVGHGRAESGDSMCVPCQFGFSRRHEARLLRTCGCRAGLCGAMRGDPCLFHQASNF